MPTAADFLQAILADPDADALRLAYADWMDEDGDAERAEFIRVQCALAAMPEGERAFHPLRQREAHLLYQHSETWLRPIRDLFPPLDLPRAGWRHWFRRSRRQAVLNAAFRRGFVEALDLDPFAFLQRADALVRMTPLRALGLDVRESADANGTLRAVTACPHLAGLRKLSLRAHRLSPDEMRRLANCPYLGSLKSLLLGCAGFERLAAQVLVTSGLVPRLKSLHVATFGADTTPWADLILEAPAVRGLTSLTVKALGGVADLFVQLGQSPPFHRLAELSLYRLWSGDHGLDEFLNWLPPTLTRLDLCRTGMGDRTATSLAHWPHLRQLRRLSLSHNEITDRGALTLADSPHLLVTTRLDLSANPISDPVKDALRIRLKHQIEI
jgi:uncharacterized protein (TIGR02996 family)